MAFGWKELHEDEQELAQTSRHVLDEYEADHEQDPTHGGEGYQSSCPPCLEAAAADLKRADLLETQTGVRVQGLDNQRRALNGVMRGMLGR